MNASTAAVTSDTVQNFGITQDGQSVQKIVLQDDVLTVSILTYGAIIQDLRMQDYDHPLVLGYESLQGYVSDPYFMGIVAGPVANRISGAKFGINGKSYTLDANDGGNSLHGGAHGLGRQIWDIVTITPTKVVLITTLADQHSGYPGPSSFEVTYSLVGGGALRVDFRAMTEKPLPVMLTQHSYFNLDGAKSVRGTQLELAAHSILEAGSDVIPSGQSIAIADSGYDFTVARTLQDVCSSLDTSFVLDRRSAGLRFAARANPAGHGPSLEVWTDQPIIHVFDGATFKDVADGLEGRTYGAFSGLCLETHGFPDAINRPEFPSNILWPAEFYRHRVEYRFDAK